MCLSPGQGSRQAEALANPGVRRRGPTSQTQRQLPEERVRGHGRSEAREDRSEDRRERESECCKVALTTGNGVVSGPAQRRRHVSL